MTPGREKQCPSAQGFPVSLALGNSVCMCREQVSALQPKWTFVNGLRADEESGAAEELCSLFIAAFALHRSGALLEAPADVHRACHVC